jgi:hypothetical protein
MSTEQGRFSQGAAAMELEAVTEMSMPTTATSESGDIDFSIVGGLSDVDGITADISDEEWSAIIANLDRDSAALPEATISLAVQDRIQDEIRSRVSVRPSELHTNLEWNRDEIARSVQESTHTSYEAHREYNTNCHSNSLTSINSIGSLGLSHLQLGANFPDHSGRNLSTGSVHTTPFTAAWVTDAFMRDTATNYPVEFAARNSSRASFSYTPLPNSTPTELQGAGSHHMAHRCEECERCFNDKRLLERHVRLEHKGWKWDCKLCPHVAETDRDLHRHIAGPHKHERNYVCPHCNKRLSRIDKLNEHIVKCKVRLRKAVGNLSNLVPHSRKHD